MMIIHYCGDCYESLPDCGEGANAFFESICEYYAIYHGIKIYFGGAQTKECRRFLRMLGCLERNRYITTTERGVHCIAIKPRGMQVVEADPDAIWHVCPRGCRG
jgi:hypothetical protein